MSSGSSISNGLLVEHMALVGDVQIVGSVLRFAWPEGLNGGQIHSLVQQVSGEGVAAMPHAA